MRIKHEIKTYIVVDSVDLEKFIFNKFGLDYNFKLDVVDEPAEGAGDSSHIFEVAEKITGNLLKEAKYWLKKGKTHRGFYQINAILAALRIAGFIDSGTYLLIHNPPQ